jgi:hypothetical protein
VYASSAEDEEIGGVNKNNSCVNGRASMNEKVSTTVDDPVNASLAEDEEIGYVNKNGSRDSGNASLNEKASASLDDSPPAKRKFAPWKLLMKRKNSSRNENSLKNKIGEKGLRKLSVEAKMAIDMMLAAKDTNGESTETKEIKDVNEESTERKESEAATEPPKRKRMSAVAEPLRGKASNSNWRSANFFEWGIMKMFECAFLPKQDDASCQSESPISKVEEGGTIIDDKLRHATNIVFVEGQKSATPDMTGSTTSSEDSSQTDDEAKSPEIGWAVEVSFEVADDPSKILETWKTTLDPNTGCSYYYNHLTRETMWMIPPDLAKNKKYQILSFSS